MSTAFPGLDRLHYVAHKSLAAATAHHRSEPNSPESMRLLEISDAWQRALDLSIELVNAITAAELAERQSGNPDDGAGMPDGAVGSETP